METKVPPRNFSSAFPRKWNEIILIIFALTVTYVCTTSQTIFSAKAVEKFCLDDSANESTRCTRNDLFIFALNSMSIFVWLSIISIKCWYTNGNVHKTIGATVEGRLFGYLQDGEKICVVNISYQIWDFFVSFLIPEFASDYIMFAHHFLATVVCWFCLEYQVRN
mmetsp:Transcript_18672/g.26299  ORF Transcript_18672/g.26299 Transcript_18672/m.26299 type:complete len:165 (-) Transcript_18672:664-1158(-)